MLKIDSQLSNLKSLTIICLNIFYPMSPFLLSSICLIFSYFTFLWAFLLLALLGLTTSIVSLTHSFVLKRYLFPALTSQKCTNVHYALYFIKTFPNKRFHVSWGFYVNFFLCQILQHLRQKTPLSSFDRDVLRDGQALLIPVSKAANKQESTHSWQATHISPN